VICYVARCSLLSISAETYRIHCSCTPRVIELSARTLHPLIRRSFLQRKANYPAACEVRYDASTYDQVFFPFDIWVLTSWQRRLPSSEHARRSFVCHDTITRSHRSRLTLILHDSDQLVFLVSVASSLFLHHACLFRPDRLTRCLYSFLLVATHFRLTARRVSAGQCFLSQLTETGVIVPTYLIEMTTIVVIWCYAFSLEYYSKTNDR